MVVEVTSMLVNQAVSPAVHPLAEKLGILLLEGQDAEEGSDYGANKIWISSKKQKEER